MPQITIDNNLKTILVPIPLTAFSGKVRIKNRSTLNEYGSPVATKQKGFEKTNYVEWQIGYDVIKKDTTKLAETSLPKSSFIGANGEEKALYELSEYIYYFYKWNVLTKGNLKQIANFLDKINDKDLLDNNKELRIKRSDLINKKLNNFDFEYTQVKYPLQIHKFGKYEIIAEIKITEKQHAIGTQPMLYLCFPITELQTNKSLIGRTAGTKEFAYFNVTKNNINFFVEILKLFGTLSKNHNYDVKKIVETILRT